MPAATTPKPSSRKKPKPGEALPSAQDWRSTDQQEILRRQLRAQEERMAIRNLDATHPVFSNFSVKSDSGMIYQVELLDVKARMFSCTCADFRKNGLGTCKHVEAVLIQAARKAGKAGWEKAMTAGSSRIEVMVDPQYGLKVWRRLESLPKAVRGMFDVHDGTLLSRVPPEEALAALERLRGADFPHLRISQEVAVWLEARTAAAERLRLRHEYEQKVHRGEWPPHETLVPLFPYQREGMLHLAFKERALLADEMGLGKTIQAIAACALLHRLGKARRVLVVTPASLKAEWEEQIGRFTRLDCRMVFGNRSQRLACYTEEAPFFTIVNYEQMVADTLDVNTRLRPDIVVLDEAQRIKNWSTKTAQAIKRLDSRYAFVLTGTPIENRIDELYSLVDFLDARVLGPLFRFNREFYDLDDKGRPKGYRNLQELHARIGPLMLRRRKAQVETELPDRTDRNHFVSLTSMQQACYAENEESAARLAAIAKRRPLKPEESKRLLLLLAKMRMICDTNYILDAEDRESPKIDELRGILDEALSNEGVKIIIFSEWERMLDLVRELCRELGAGFAWHTGSVPQQKRRLEINAFKNDPDCRIFLSTDAGATGLNLQNASVVINCDLPWNPAKLEQRIARAWRKHQTRAVTVINLIAENTIEHRMLGTLAEKTALAQGVLDAGDIDTMDLRGGRDSFFKRLEQMLAPGHLGKGTPLEVPRTPSDPSLALAQAAAIVLGPLLWKCEERRPAPDKPPVCLMVVERDAAAARDRLRQVIDDAGARQTIEVMDRAGYETLQRLAAAGLIQFSTDAVRELHPEPQPAPPSPPGLSAESLARIGVLMETAAHHLRLAEVLQASQFVREARTSLEAAALALSRGLAVAAGAEEPEDLAAALTDEALARWEWSALLVGTLAGPEDLDYPAVREALRKTETRLRSKAGLRGSVGAG
jgi:superfamily II DNA or RNA helicase